MVRLSEEPRPGKGKGSQTKDEEAPKKDESETSPCALMVKLSDDPVRPGKFTKDEEAPKKDESETESKKKPPNWTSQQKDESQKKTAEEHIPKNPWIRFQQRLRGSGIGGEKKFLAALYREEQTALRTREGEGS